jgi:hypothetical protein
MTGSIACPHELQVPIRLIALVKTEDVAKKIFKGYN